MEARLGCDRPGHDCRSRSRLGNDRPAFESDSLSVADARQHEDHDSRLRRGSCRCNSARATTGPCLPTRLGPGRTCEPLRGPSGPFSASAVPSWPSLRSTMSRSRAPGASLRAGPYFVGLGAGSAADVRARGGHGDQLGREPVGLTGSTTVVTAVNGARSPGPGSDDQPHREAGDGE